MVFPSSTTEAYDFSEFNRLLVSTMANPTLRTLFWCRKCAKKDWAIAAVGFTVIIFTISLFSDWRTVDNSAFDTDLPATLIADEFVELTLLRNAKEKGAVCLDGSSPAYHFQRGSGSGSNNWLVYIEGGGWCNTIASCSQRKLTPLGSSNYMERQVRFTGMLSPDPIQNPEFFSWNKVKVRYCDGASLAGHPESEPKNGSKLFFRGQLIWETLMEELLSIGLSNAKQALLAGCSAGGLATLIHCDDFQERLPQSETVKCLADAGFFLDEKDVLGNSTMRSFYSDVVQLQGVSKSLNKNCIARSKSSDSSKCLFPQEITRDIRTPLFLVNPAYDFWQIQHILIPDISDPHGHWLKCRMSIHYCNPSQMEMLQGFRSSLMNALSEFQQKKEVGLFINSCFIHCQTFMSETWHSRNSPKINNKTIAESVGDWYFGREVQKQIDCPYPCNPTCHHMNFLRP